jgi:site-specific DNA-methyltransferase (adenine-specific)
MRLDHADCLEFLASIPDESVELIIADPPYFRRVKDYWDNQWKSEQDYLAWCDKWIAESVRVLAPGGCLYVWGTTKSDTFLRLKLNVLNRYEELVYQNWIVWNYDWGGRTKKTFPRKHEDLLMYSKGKTFTFNADDVRVPYKMKSNVRSTAQNNPKGKIPTDVWTKNNHTTSREYAGWHTTQKPIALLERIVLANTDPGDTVVDFFSGSGSTAVAALRHDRKFAGCEFDINYYLKSKQRIKELT